MESLEQTPLRALHEESGARFVPFAGWEMPVQYSGILEEHRAVRERAGLFDVSHMGEVEVEGSGAEDFLEYLLTNRVANLAEGRARYSPMCLDDGGTVDDLIFYRRGPEFFLICVNASNTRMDLDWMREIRERRGFECEIRDRSREYGLIALQGPLAIGIAQKLLGEEVAAIPRFGFEIRSWEQSEIIVSRTGYTGEDGLELYVPTAGAEALARALLRTGEPEGLRLCGLGARDSLRLEAGMPLYGHELGRSIHPLQAGLGWSVKLSKEDFVGREALAAAKADGSYARVVHYVLPDRRIARQGTPIYAADREAGKVLSGSLSPMLGRGIGSALVAEEAIEAPEGLTVDLRGKRILIEKRIPPLHRPNA